MKGLDLAATVVDDGGAGVQERALKRPEWAAEALYGLARDWASVLAVKPLVVCHERRRAFRLRGRGIQAPEQLR